MVKVTIYTIAGLCLISLASTQIGLCKAENVVQNNDNNEDAQLLRQFHSEVQNIQALSRSSSSLSLRTLLGLQDSTGIVRLSNAHPSFMNADDDALKSRMKRQASSRQGPPKLKSRRVMRNSKRKLRHGIKPKRRS